MLRIIWFPILLIILANVPDYVECKRKDSDVKERDLVTQKIDSPSNILDNYDNYCKKCAKKKHFKGDVLGFVTQSNTKGYDTSETFAKKFNLLSPEWLDLAVSDDDKFEMIGLNNTNKTWMSKVRESKDSRVKIVPKMNFYRLSDRKVKEYLEDKKQQYHLIKYLLDTCNEHNFDGLVINMFAKFAWASKNQTHRLINKIADEFHAKDKKMYLMIHPPFSKFDMNSDQPKGAFTKQDFGQLKDSVDGFPLVLYDYSEYTDIEPNAPLDWIKKNVLHFVKDEDKKYKEKVLMGLNFYGVRYDKSNPRSNEAIAGARFIELLKADTSMKINYDQDEGEHTFDTIDHRIYYPTLYSINKRLKLAKELGTGVFIWELGQGLNYFYDLF